jgi:hypothetical protein
VSLDESTSTAGQFEQFCEAVGALVEVDSDRRWMVKNDQSNNSIWVDFSKQQAKCRCKLLNAGKKKVPQVVEWMTSERDGDSSEDGNGSVPAPVEVKWGGAKNSLL